PDAPLVVHAPAALFLASLDHPQLAPPAVLLRADLPASRSLTALAVGELRSRGIRARIATRPLGRIAARRALAGIEPGGAASRRMERLARGLVGGLRRARGEAGQ